MLSHFFLVANLSFDNKNHQISQPTLGQVHLILVETRSSEDGVQWHSFFSHPRMFLCTVKNQPNIHTSIAFT